MDAPLAKGPYRLVHFTLTVPSTAMSGVGREQAFASAGKTKARQPKLTGRSPGGGEFFQGMNR